MSFNLTDLSREEVRDFGWRLGFDLSPTELDAITDFLSFAYYSNLDQFGVTQSPGPSDERSRRVIDDPHNAFITPLSIPGDSGPLSGVDVAVKDNVAIAGVPMTCGTRVFESATPQRDAAVIDRLLGSGARIVGKTNMDELAFGPTGETSQFGPALNPVDEARVTGGSSSGSAAAVASGAADAALGSDTGGSVRIPSAFCGTVGFKPTWGVISRTGFVELAYTLDTIGVLASDVETAARVTASLVGFDPHDPVTGRAGYLDPIEPGDVASIGELSFAVPVEFFGEHVEPGVEEVIRGELDGLASTGATVEEVSIPGMANAVSMWNGVTTIEFASVIAGRGAPVHRRARVDPSWHDAVSAAVQADGAGFGDIVKLKAIEGAALLDRYGSRYYVRAQEAVTALTREFEGVLEDYDAMVTPTMPLVAPELGEWEGYGSELPMAYNTRPVNLTGMPAITVPAGRADGLPVGIQFIGDTFADAEVFRIGQAYEAHRDTA